MHNRPGGNLGARLGIGADDLPGGDGVLHWSMACPTTRPAPWIAACAVAWSWPVTSGTTVQGPEDTVSC
ncbi:MAG: hypothetical protein KBH78_08265, partial [Candidatus Hydrogenedentes bacterium]|nr:hypothetical protein [Candidatus Hydrogenedentota bacterium]